MNLKLGRRKAPLSVPALCAWCGTARPADLAGWTVNPLEESFVARFATSHAFGGTTGNCITVTAGNRTACPTCGGDLAAGRYAALAARSDGGPTTAPYIEAVARRLGPAVPLTKETN